MEERNRPNKISQETKQLLRKRREWKHCKSIRNHIEYIELCKTIGKWVKEIRQFNCQLIQTTIENNKSLKKMKQKLMTGKKRLFKIRKEDGSMTSNQQEILERVKEFYSTLYTDSVEQITNDSIETTDGPPYMLLDEVRQAIQNLKNGKAAGPDGITGEIVRLCGTETYKALADLFTRCLKQKKIPTTWIDAKVIILHKKGEHENLKNYRPISLLSLIYKAFTKIIVKRLETTLDYTQPKEQAGFRSGYSTMDNIQVVYNKSLNDAMNKKYRFVSHS